MTRTAMNAALPPAQFTTPRGLIVGAVSRPQYDAMYAALQRDYGLTTAQVCEAASYSMAMVVRYALGLSAAEGEVAVLVNDSLSGCVALATARHLHNAGAHVNLVLLERPPEFSADFLLQMQPFNRSGVELHDCSTNYTSPEFTQFLSQCHNAICGLFGTNTDFSALNLILNEVRTPIHAVQAPLNLDVDTGAHKHGTLQASSTLSLGAPFSGLYHGSDFAGRHYLCDISITPELYQAHGLAIAPAFAEQPVVQIFPAGKGQAEDDESEPAGP